MRFVPILVVLATWPVAAAAQGPCPRGTTLPVHIRVEHPVCPERPVRLVAEACGPCVDLLGWSFAATAVPELHVAMDERACILDICQPESAGVAIGRFAAGSHRLVIVTHGRVTRADSTDCLVTRRDTLRFEVPRSCEPGPPSGLPYTDRIEIGPPPPCPTCPRPAICPHVEIPFLIAGHLPDSCLEFRGLELLPTPEAGPTPRPPVARVTMARLDCPGEPCRRRPGPASWQAMARLPGLPGGDYRLRVEMRVVRGCDSTVVSDTLAAVAVPFAVAARCTAPPPPRLDCQYHHWKAGDDSCDATVAPGLPARLELRFTTGVPAAGIQGRLLLGAPGLAIHSLRPIGAAARMRIAWRPLEDGASFVMFDAGGGPILGEGLPVLEVAVALRGGATLRRSASLHLADVLVSDSAGREIPQCPNVRIRPAEICPAPGCDLNGDGRLDVRDLVVMAGCVTGRRPCHADTAAGSLDCDRNGRIDVDDVLCCARLLLHGRIEPGAVARSAPELRVTVGRPLAMEGGIRVPVRVHRADLVGAARLAFSYPADRLAGAVVELPEGASDWLEVSEAAAGELVVGLIATGPERRLPADLDLVLRFDALAGPAPGSDVRLVGTEFAGPDGAALAPGASATLPAAGVELSAARPNPFTRETRFVVALSAAAEIDLGIFDLVGRRVATLHRGRLDAGAHPFRWDGRHEQGGRAPEGVYFYRAQGSGARVSRKLVLIAGD